MEVKKKKEELAKKEAEVEKAKKEADAQMNSTEVKPADEKKEEQKKKDQQNELLDAFEQEIFDWSNAQMYEF